MIFIKLNLPSGSNETGELLRDYSQNHRRLTQDILQVHLPSGQTIDVGWYPEFNPAGLFQVFVFDGEWENRIEGPIEARTPAAVAATVEEIAERLFRAQFANKSAQTVRVHHFPVSPSMAFSLVHA